MAEVDWDALDYDDPCAVLAALRPALHRLYAGEVETEIRYQDKSLRFRDADLTRLEAKVAALETACAAKQGKRRRFAKRVRFG